MPDVNSGDADFDLASEAVTDRFLALLVLKNGGSASMTLDEMASMNDYEFHAKLSDDKKTFHLSVTRR